jgi:hypothetical protein
MTLQLSQPYNVYDEMKSWSLGRKSGKKDRKSKSPESSPTRPKSLLINSPSSSSGAELASSVQASPSLTFSTSPHSRQSSHENELTSSPSASKYLSTTQLKDKVRRLKTTSTNSSRPPLTAKKQNQNGATDGDTTRVRTTSLPSLIKSPIAAQPTPSAPLVSPAAAVVGGRPSTDSHENNPFSDVSSLESANHPPSPSSAPRQDPLAPLLSSQANHTCETHQEDLPSKSKPSEISKASEMTPKAEEATQYPSTVASLRRFKGVEGFGSLDKVKHAHFDSMTVKESEEKEAAATTQSTTMTKTTTTTTSKEQQKYPFAIRKNRSGPAPKGQQKALTRRSNPRKVEAKYDVAIETQRVLSWSFNQVATGNVVVRQRRIVAIPIPSLFGADQAASWTVERISRLTSCLIYAFGS